MTLHHLTEDDLKVLLANRDRGRISPGSASGARHPKGVKVGEPHTIDAMRNQSTKGPGNVKSGVRTPQATNGFRSKWEAAYASKLELEKHAGLIQQYWYEPFSIWLPGKVRYKPDFMIERHSVNPWGGRMYPNIEIIEVKGWSKNRRDGMTRLKIAAALFPCFTWTLVRKTKDGWDEEHV